MENNDLKLAMSFCKESAFETISNIIGEPWEYAYDPKESKNLIMQTLFAIYGVVKNTKDITDALEKGYKENVNK